MEGFRTYVSTMEQQRLTGADRQRDPRRIVDLHALRVVRLDLATAVQAFARPAAAAADVHAAARHPGIDRAGVDDRVAGEVVKPGISPGLGDRQVRSEDVV